MDTCKATLVSCSLMQNLGKLGLCNRKGLGGKNNPIFRLLIGKECINILQSLSELMDCNTKHDV